MKKDTVKNTSRPSWDDYFKQILHDVASRSTCLRRQVGCIIVRDKRILSTGYNGTPKGIEHCDKRGCQRANLNIPSGERHELCNGVHAEQNAIIQAAYHGVSIKEAWLYCTHTPCNICAKMIINAGITRVLFVFDYSDPATTNLLKEAGITYKRL